MALTRLYPLGEGLTEQWSGAGCSQERLRDHAAANAQRLRLGASPPQKKFMRSFQGLWKITTHLAPGFTLNDLVPAQRMWLFSGVCWHPCLGGSTQPLPDVLPAGEPPLPCGLQTHRLHSALGDSPFPPAHLQVLNCRVSGSVLPLFIES